MAPVVAFAKTLQNILKVFEIELHKMEEIVAQCFYIAIVRGFYPSFIVVHIRYFGVG